MSDKETVRLVGGSSDGAVLSVPPGIEILRMPVPPAIPPPPQKGDAYVLNASYELETYERRHEGRYAGLWANGVFDIKI